MLRDIILILTRPLSGAVQDHDRGLVVGEATFGKGLVQRVIPLQSGGALAVTTAKYYTPSGRLIQRDYTDLEEYYLERSDGGRGEPGLSESPRARVRSRRRRLRGRRQFVPAVDQRGRAGGGGVRK